jgi:hypothetical protein
MYFLFTIDIFYLTDFETCYFTFIGIRVAPLKTKGTGCCNCPSVDWSNSVGDDDAARGDANMDFMLSGKFGISSPLRKRPGLDARILK